MKELWRDTKVLVSSYDGSDSFRNAGRSLFQRGGTAIAIERSANLSDEMTEGRRSVRADLIDLPLISCRQTATATSYR